MLCAMSLRTVHILTVIGLVLCAAAAAENVDWPGPGMVSATDQVNEGDLAFLSAIPERRVLQTHNRLIISTDSLVSGWVELEQCQGNLDPVDVVEIVYRYRGLRNLQVQSVTAMEAARVEGDSVQLTGVQPGGEVCITAEVAVLKADAGGGYRLQSGPFHRRFLDGYYPIQLDYAVTWPESRLVLASVAPAAQRGFTVRSQPGSLHIETLFEGMLTIELQFRPR